MQCQAAIPIKYCTSMINKSTTNRYTSINSKAGSQLKDENASSYVIAVNSEFITRIEKNWFTF